jgi:hypothetical protein
MPIRNGAQRLLLTKKLKQMKTAKREILELVGCILAGAIAGAILSNLITNLIL